MKRMKNQASVKIIDVDTMKVTEIPRAELSDQMVPARIEGRPGECWVDARQAMGRSKGVLHPPFSGERKERVEAIASMFREVHPLSYEQWEIGFQEDANPDQEIAIWLRSGKLFTEFSHERGLDLPQRKELAKLLFQCQVVPLDQLEAVRVHPDLPKELCDDFIKAYYDFGRLVCPPTTTPGVSQNPELLRLADVILATDSRTGGQTLLHGAELLERIAQGSDSVPCVVATVSYSNRKEFRAVSRLVRKLKKGS